MVLYECMIFLPVLDNPVLLAINILTLKTITNSKNAMI